MYCSVCSLEATTQGSTAPRSSLHIVQYALPLLSTRHLGTKCTSSSISLAVIVRLPRALVNPSMLMRHDAATTPLEVTNRRPVGGRDAGARAAQKSWQRSPVEQPG